MKEKRKLTLVSAVCTNLFARLDILQKEWMTQQAYKTFTQGAEKETRTLSGLFKPKARVSHVEC